jgi:hypothetical protein
MTTASWGTAIATPISWGSTLKPVRTGRSSSQSPGLHKARPGWNCSMLPSGEDRAIWNGVLQLAQGPERSRIELHCFDGLGELEFRHRLILNRNPSISRSPHQLPNEPTRAGRSWLPRLAVLQRSSPVNRYPRIPNEPTPARRRRAASSTRRIAQETRRRRGK